MSYFCWEIGIIIVGKGICGFSFFLFMRFCVLEGGIRLFMRVIFLKYNFYYFVIIWVLNKNGV